jgi:conjugative transfer pilus assembly protein TraH
MNTYTGGSLMLRSPNKVYQLATIQFPYVRAGCGGIDAFGGSFSHVSSQEFKNILKNVTSALPGVAFQLALSSVSPLLGEKVQDQVAGAFINNARINSARRPGAGGAVSQALRRQRLVPAHRADPGVATDEDDAGRNAAPTSRAPDQARAPATPTPRAMARSWQPDVDALKA